MQKPETCACTLEGVEVAQLHQRLKTVTRLDNDHRRVITANKEEICELKSNLSWYERDREELQNNLGAALEENRAAMRGTLEAQQRYDRFLGKYMENAAQLTQSKKDESIRYLILQKQVTEETAQKLGALKEKLKDLRAEGQMQSRKLADLKLEKENMRRECNVRLGNIHKQKNDEMDELRLELDELRMEVFVHIEHVEDLQQELTAKDEQMVDMAEPRKILEKEIVSLRGHIKDCESRNRSLYQTLENERMKHQKELQQKDELNQILITNNQKYGTRLADNQMTIKIMREGEARKDIRIAALSDAAKT